jgi:hypothetical protein
MTITRIRSRRNPNLNRKVRQQLKFGLVHDNIGKLYPYGVVCRQDDGVTIVPIVTPQTVSTYLESKPAHSGFHLKKHEANYWISSKSRTKSHTND